MRVVNPYLKSEKQLKWQAEAQKKLADMKTFDEHTDGCAPCIDGGGRTERWPELCLACEEPCFWHWRYKHSDRSKGWDSRNPDDSATFNKWLGYRRGKWNREHE